MNYWPPTGKVVNSGEVGRTKATVTEIFPINLRRPIALLCHGTWVRRGFELNPFTRPGAA